MYEPFYQFPVLCSRCLEVKQLLQRWQGLYEIILLSLHTLRSISAYFVFLCKQKVFSFPWRSVCHNCLYSQIKMKEKAVRLLLVLLCLQATYPENQALECYNCRKIGDVHGCHNTTRCNFGESCFMNVSLSQSDGSPQLNLGCLENQKCGRASSEVIAVGKRRQTHDCHECCSTDFCNIGLCSHHKPSTCVDDEQEDCARLHSLFNICNDIQHAKLICPKFCNLCHVVDGNWSPWSSWTPCDVTCDNGTQTRTRTCTAPAPANGGDGCFGIGTENKQCVKPLCPVHGGWSIWSSWGSCSVSCDFGLQRRDRTCSNPYPSRFGDHCYGESRDDRICLQQPCATHAGWGTWSSWGSCSVSCDIGLQRRDRSCSNPYPSRFGDNCYGDSRDDRICLQQPCANGGWASWESWSACSMTCGGGMQSRSRSCSNPNHSILGNYCAGDAQGTRTCNSQRCPPIVSTFSVDHPYNYSSFHGTNKLTFSHTIYQHGGDFNPSTGTFTCSIPGTYHFSVTLVKQRSSSRVDKVYCYLYKSRSSQILIYVNPTDDDTDKGSAAVSQSMVLHLVRGDTVFLGSCNGQPSTYMESWSSFTGFLLYPDS